MSDIEERWSRFLAAEDEWERLMLAWCEDPSPEKSDAAGVALRAAEAILDETPGIKMTRYPTREVTCGEQ